MSAAVSTIVSLLAQNAEVMRKSSDSNNADAKRARDRSFERKAEALEKEKDAAVAANKMAMWQAVGSSVSAFAQIGGAIAGAESETLSKWLGAAGASGSLLSAKAGYTYGKEQRAASLEAQEHRLAAELEAATQSEHEKLSKDFKAEREARLQLARAAAQKHA
jgi:hypothetical protein